MFREEKISMRYKDGHLSPERWILEEELGGKRLGIWLLATGCPPGKWVGSSSD